MNRRGFLVNLALFGVALFTLFYLLFLAPPFWGRVSLDPRPGPDWSPRLLRCVELGICGPGFLVLVPRKGLEETLEARRRALATSLILSEDPIEQDLGFRMLSSRSSGLVALAPNPEGYTAALGISEVCGPEGEGGEALYEGVVVLSPWWPRPPRVEGPEPFGSLGRRLERERAQELGFLPSTVPAPAAVMPLFEEQAARVHTAVCGTATLWSRDKK